jgi:glycosyltransferase involved in cell wall biosynthesis
MSPPKTCPACVILTKNEELTLGQSLASVAWCSERVVVDSGSTDQTRELAESTGARFLVHVQAGNFNIAEQRNWALESAGIQSEWILFLDADEEVTPALRAAIERELAAPGGFNAYELTPRYLFWGKWLKRTQGFPNWHPRMVKRGHAWFTGGVWEHFDSRAIIGRIEEPYNHYANSKGLSDWLARHDRYSTWDAQKIVAYLETRDPKALGTERKATLRLCAAQFYPLRPFARFLHIYLLRMGFLEGIPALVFSYQYFVYETFTVIKVWELKRKNRLQSL